MGVNDQKPPDRSRHLQGKFLRVRIPNNVVGVNNICLSSLPGGSSSESVLVDNQWRRITPVVGSRDQCSRGDRRCDHPLDLRFSTPSLTPSWRRNNSGFLGIIWPHCRDPLLNIKEHSGKRYCKNKFNKKKI